VAVLLVVLAGGLVRQGLVRLGDVLGEVGGGGRVRVLVGVVLRGREGGERREREGREKGEGGKEMEER